MNNIHFIKVNNDIFSITNSELLDGINNSKDIILSKLNFYEQVDEISEDDFNKISFLFPQLEIKNVSQFTTKSLVQPLTYENIGLLNALIENNMLDILEKLISLNQSYFLAIVLLYEEGYINLKRIKTLISNENIASLQVNISRYLKTDDYLYFEDAIVNYLLYNLKFKNCTSVNDDENNFIIMDKNEIEIIEIDYPQLREFINLFISEQLSNSSSNIIFFDVEEMFSKYSEDSTGSSIIKNNEIDYINAFLKFIKDFKECAFDKRVLGLDTYINQETKFIECLKKIQNSISSKYQNQNFSDYLI